MKHSKPYQRSKQTNVRQALYNAPGRSKPEQRRITPKIRSNLVAASYDPHSSTLEQVYRCDDANKYLVTHSYLGQRVA